MDQVDNYRQTQAGFGIPYPPQHGKHPIIKSERNHGNAEPDDIGSCFFTDDGICRAEHPVDCRAGNSQQQRTGDEGHRTGSKHRLPGRAPHFLLVPLPFILRDHHRAARSDCAGKRDNHVSQRADQTDCRHGFLAGRADHRSGQHPDQINKKLVN